MTIADLTGKVALVTGGASGIGRAVVECFLAQGATVVATDVDEAGLHGLAADLSGQAVTTRRLDVTDAADTRAAVADTVAAHGALHLVVCSAGIVMAEDRAPGEDAARDWDRCFAVNVRGVVNTCEAALPALRATAGAIVTIGSISAHSARATVGAYPASKAAALRYIKGLALSLAPQVRANAVCPGAVWTGMQARILAEVDHAAARRGQTVATDRDPETAFAERYASTIPLRRPQTPADVAKAVAFLASDDAANITGQCLHVDGGAVVRD